MADTKISALPAVTDVQDADEYVIARAGGTKKITGANLKAGIPAAGAPTSRNLTAGAGLTGGGDLTADRTFAVNVDGTTLEVVSDTVRVKDGGITAAKVAADVATQAELDAHLADTTAAHAASAISFTPGGTVAATDVQAAIAEVASEAAAGGGIPATIFDAKGDLVAASAADTAARLAVGSNDQVLVADSTQTTGLKWAAVPGLSAYVPVSTIDAKGDLLAGTANDTIARLAVGTNGQVLTADSAQTTGIKWATPSGGGGGGAWTLLSTTTLSSPGTFDVSSISGSHNDLILVATIRDSVASTNADLEMQLNGDTGSNYAYKRITDGTAFDDFSNSFMGCGRVAGSTAAANSFGTTIIELPGYASTTWLKTMMFNSIYHSSMAAGATIRQIGGGVWNSTAAITRVVIKHGANTFATGSQLRIYGRL